ncbi:hypothetical protein [Streptomyces griseus]|uniref:hypothetical protein n=1 Tax=Streptomyces griseus TaxID=1911 RepID=UPI000AA94333|nr:hypothetical protein [Streptomyces griseus]
MRPYGVRSGRDHLVHDARGHEPAFHAEPERLETALTARHLCARAARLFPAAARKHR